MLNAKYAVACLAAVVVLGLPLSAGARLSANGTSLNGVSLNGIRVNGIRVNGIRVNGIRVNGIRVNGIRVNGTGLQLSPVATQGIVRVEGGRLVIQATSTNQ
jgi:hypothetical protein